MKKNTLSCFLLICISTVLITSCDMLNSLFNKNIAIPGRTLLITDSNGHFTEDITYSQGYYSNKTYYTDGSCEWNYYTYSSEDSENVLSFAYKGNYSWDSETLIASIDINSTYNYPDENWVTNLSYSTTEDYYFAETYSDVLFKKSTDDENTWIYNKTETDGIEYYDVTEKYTFGYSELLYERTSTITDADGNTLSNNQYKTKYRIVELFPSGTSNLKYEYKML